MNPLVPSSNPSVAQTTARRLRRSVLTLSLLALWAADPSPSAAAATWTVDTCDERTIGTGMSGSLRYVVANAGDDDTIDLTQLTCGTISLQTGAIVVTQPHLHFQGPGRDNLAIAGAQEHDRIFRQVLPRGAYDGEIYFSDLSISGGNYASPGQSSGGGGCIYSYTRVTLTNSDVSDCHARSESTASGGAVFAKQKVTLVSSSVRNSDATATGDSYYDGLAWGGGIWTRSLSMQQSTISGNAAIATHSAGIAVGGGIYAVGADNGIVSIRDSTISGNQASGSNGALGIAGGGSIQSNVPQTLISNSTIADNVSTLIVGGILVNSPSITIGNSTIAGNVAQAPAPPPGSTVIWAAGLAANSSLAPIAMTLRSSIVADNRQSVAAPYASDFGAIVGHGNALTISGGQNLVGAPLAASVAMPGPTISGACALLGPLRDNGGATFTRALQSTSPAIDAGSNKDNLDHDQRGAARVSGKAADIGAYELDQRDVIWSAGFEGC